jgi:hypothetical protein
VPARVVLGIAAGLSVLALVWLVSNRAEADFALAYARLYALDGDAGFVRQGHDANAIAALATASAAPGEIANNQGMLAATAWRALATAALGLAVLWRVRRWTMPVLIAATAVELLLTGLGPVQTVPADRVTALPKVLEPVRTSYVENAPRPRLQRLVVMDRDHVGAALPANLPGFLGLDDASAYNPLPPARFEQFFEAIEPGVGYGGAGVGPLHDPKSLAHPLCDLYGIRYVLTRDEVPPRDGLVDRTPPGTGGFRLLERTTTLPRATFVRDVDVIPEADRRLAALADPTRDVKTRVVLEHEAAPVPSAAADASATVDVVVHEDERVVVRVTCSHDGYLRLADPFDPGWTATVDGEPAVIHAADHYLRAVYVPAGEHELVFAYDGARAVWPLRLTLMALVAVAWLLFGGRRKG